MENNSKVATGCPIRQSNYELLRIVCMLFIICGHLIIAHRSVEEPWSGIYIINHIVRGFICVGVNVFVLISGYWGIKLNTPKLWKFNWMVTFYCVLFLVVGICLGIHQIPIRKDLLLLFPVVTRQYWFITTYFILCFIAPYLNMLVEKLNQSEHRKLVLILFAFVCLQPSLSKVLLFDPAILGDGYGLANFIMLYMVGRYLRLYVNIKESHRYLYLAGFLISSSMIGLGNLTFSYRLGDFHSFIGYDFVLCQLSALCLFLFFSTLQFSSVTVNRLATSCLAVYVIHESPTFKEYMWNSLFHVKCYGGGIYVASLIVIPIVIYFLASLIEFMREQLFAVIINARFYATKQS